ncbi:10839_t:CDS:2, partial [Funneliformis geosporum]
MRSLETKTSTDGSNTFSQLDGLEKQLEERETLLRQKKNNIKKTIETLVDEERKYLKDEYDTQKTIIEKDKEIGKLSTTISQTKKDKNTLKKDFASAKKTIKVLNDIIYSKDKTIIAYNEG